MQENKKGTGIKPAPPTNSNHIIIDRLSLFFFIVFFTVIIIDQFYPNDRLLGFGLGMGLAALFSHSVAMKLDYEVSQFDKDSN